MCPHVCAPARATIFRPRVVWVLGLLVGFVTQEATAQFNPRGRGPRQGASAAPTKPEPQAPQAQASSEKRDAQLIERYEKLIYAQPGEDVPLTRLAELVRQRDGNLAQLLESLEKSAATAKDKYAALIAWGGILSKDGQVEEAIARLEQAAALEPNRPEAWQLLGRLQTSQGNVASARNSFEKASAHVTGPERSLLLRTLRDLSLDAGDYEAARKHHQTLSREAQGNLFLQGELGRELLSRGQAERAVEELSRVVKGATGDARALAPALRDLGEAQIEAGKPKEAILNLKKASRLAAASPGLRTAIDTLRAQAHRNEGSLATFLEELEREASNAPRLGLLGRLQEEAGSTEKAVSAYERALKLDANNIDLRLRLVRLYELTGDIEQAVVEYGKLVRSSPRDVQLSLRYMEMLLAQGERGRALAELDRIDNLTTTDPESGLLLLDFVERLEETQRSKRILSRLSRSGSRDARFLVELGSRHYQRGATEAAHKVWKKIVDVSSDRAQGHLTYGEVLLDHESATEGVAQLRKADELSPRSVRVKKALALGLERAATQAQAGAKSSYEQGALRAWQELLELEPSATDPGAEQARTLARRHIVRIWKRTGRLAEELPPLERRFSKSPPDLAAGRLLVEAYLSTRADDRAISVLERILRAAPGDRASLVALEAAHTRNGNYSGAIAVLKKLVEADPRRAREYYDRMARAATRQNNPEGALKYAELAVQKSPTDPAAQASLGDLYLSQGRLKEAESAYRRALSQDDRLHTVSLRLAEILTKTGRAPEALDVLLHVTRSAHDTEAIQISARRAIAISVPLERERAVEDVLRPLSISHPDKPLYRSLLLEVLSSQMYPLALASEHGQGAQRDEAQTKLRKLSDRSTGPLLAALSGTNASEQQIAISLLAHGSTKSAASGLIAFAEGSAQEEQRLLAVLAAGNLKTEQLSQRLSSLIVSDGTLRRGRIGRAAVWALSRQPGSETSTTLLEALRDGDPELKAYAALGLGDLNLRGAARSEVIDALKEVIVGVENGTVARSAAALSLGRLFDHTSASDLKRTQSEEILLDAHAARSTLLKQASIVSLARVTQGARVRERVSAALFSEDPDVREAATFGATLLVPETKAAQQPSLLPDRLTPSEMDAALRVRSALSLSLAPATKSSRHEALVALELDLVDQAKVALRSSAASASAVLQQIRPREGHILFGQLLLFEDLHEPTPSTRAALAAVQRLRSALSEEIVALAGGPHPSLSESALRALRPTDGPDAERILAKQLRNPSQQVHLAALSAIETTPADESLQLLQAYLKEESSWGRRRRVASALGDLMRLGGGSEVSTQAREMLKSLTDDTNDLVRTEAEAQLKRSAPGAKRPSGE